MYMFIPTIVVVGIFALVYIVTRCFPIDVKSEINEEIVE